MAANFPPNNVNDLASHDDAKTQSPSALAAWAPPVLWAATLFGLSSIPGQHIPTIGFSFSDKVEHFCAYGILGVLCFRALRLTTALRIGGAILVVAAVALGYGISDEIHQLFVPLRSSEALDALADLCGGTAGAIVGSRIAWLRKQRG